MGGASLFSPGLQGVPGVTKPWPQGQFGAQSTAGPLNNPYGQQSSGHTAAMVQALRGGNG